MAAVTRPSQVEQDGESPNMFLYDCIFGQDIVRVAQKTHRDAGTTMAVVMHVALRPAPSDRCYRYKSLRYQPLYGL